MSRRSRHAWRTTVTFAVTLAALVTLTLALSSAAEARSPRAAVSTRASPVAANSAEGAQWAWPVAPPILVARGFAAPATPYSAGHRGIDVAIGAGADVRAPADAVVSFAGVVVDRPVLTLDVGGDVLVSFEPLEVVVSKGDRVAGGQVVGRVAVGGHCGSVCLHVGVRLHGAYVSPLLFFGRVPRAVLLPID